MVKEQIRIMGVDDAAFRFRDENTLVIGVVVRTPAYIEAVLSTEVEIDGTNSTSKIIDLVKRSRHKDQIKAVMIDGASLGGFNIIDTEKLFSSVKIPIITITRDYPDFDSIKSALKKHFQDWKTRWDLITEGELIEVKTLHNPVFIKNTGISKNEAIELIKLTTVRGVLPEPVRLAHLIASGITTGESVSKA